MSAQQRGHSGHRTTSKKSARNRTGRKKTASRKRPPTPTYRIPALWNCWGYAGPTKSFGREVAVSPRAYFDACIAWIRAQGERRPRFAHRSLSLIEGVRPAAKGNVRDGQSIRRAGDWIRTASLYGLMVRTSTAWDHNANGKITTAAPNELGTFAKTILLLPHLDRMGIDVLYTLPIVKVSHLFRKGELGCPYSAKNFFALDADQADETLAGHIGDVADQFRLLVECAHRLGIRVMLDIAPRTAARDADWILDFPEWFYWIDRKFARNFSAPKIPGVDYVNPIPGRLDEIYSVPAVRRFLKQFRFAPNITQSEKWHNFVTRAKKRSSDDFLGEIEKHFGVITAPGFSDVVNDTQPPWSDVTYLRLFLDHPVEAAKYLRDPDEQPPYVLYDTAKASLFPGRKPNKALWTKLTDIIPFYQKFGVDGARVDMAHALPNSLERLILDKPRRRDPDFCFLAEELGAGNHKKVYAAGYNILIGPSWWMQPRAREGRMHELLADLPTFKVPIMAAAETPDTPRAVSRRGGRAFAQQAIVINSLLPNAVPMVNGGMEVYERQPMNLGLDAKPKDRRALSKRDPFYGKLAFFDRYVLHWTTTGADDMIELIAEAAAIRRRFLDALTASRAYFAPHVATGRKWTLATGYRLDARQGILLMLANVDTDKAHRTSITGLRTRRTRPEVLLQTQGSAPPTVRRGKLSMRLDPAEAVVMIV